jgi:uncharacterized integral membrane protein
MADDPQPPAATPPRKEGLPWRLIAFGVIAVYGVLLVLFNADTVDVSFVFFSAEASLVVLLLITLGIGFLAGFLFDTIRERRRRKAS